MAKRVHEVWKGSNVRYLGLCSRFCWVFAVPLLLLDSRIAFIVQTIWLSCGRTQFAFVIFFVLVGIYCDACMPIRFDSGVGTWNKSSGLIQCPVDTVCHGKQIFLFDGRLIFGPDARSLLVTSLLITVPVVIFCVFVARHLRHKFSPYNAGYAILIAAVFFTIHVLVLLFLTSARDPGIVPRNSHPPDEEFRVGTSASPEIGLATLSLPRFKEVMVNGLPVRVKYCETCMLFRPPRCSHCSICNNCVERFDHHCPWVGQCIGTRNYRYFFSFVSSATLLCIFVFGISAFYIKVLMDDNQGTVWRAMKESPASVILMAYCFISLWFVGGLTGFHLYLIGTNQTTYENFRYRTDNRINVYDRGCASNFFEVFCTKVKPSKNNFRALAEEEPLTPPLPTTRNTEAEETAGDDRRMKVEDDLDLGGDLLKISQRHNIEDIEADIRSRGSDVLHQNSSEADSALGSDRRAPAVHQSDTLKLE